MSPTSVRITEIFYSLQGESRTQGCPTVFVRLTGCPLRCRYCDTAYAFSGGEVMPLDAIEQRIASYKPRFVTVTGGEPLAQPGCIELLKALCDKGYDVSLETSGALPITDVDHRAVVVLDLKTPASGEMNKNDYANLALLKPGDQVKFVICNREDYQWARMQLDLQNLGKRAGDVLFSPSYGELDPRQLAEWILEDNLPVRMQMQLHKLLWQDAAGH